MKSSYNSHKLFVLFFPVGVMDNAAGFRTDVDHIVVLNNRDVLHNTSAAGLKPQNALQSCCGSAVWLIKQHLF